MDKAEALARPGPPARHDSSPLPSSHDTSSPSTSPSPVAPGRKRSGSGSSILSKFPFMRTTESRSNLREVRENSGPDAPDDDNDINKSSHSTKDNKSAPRSISLQQEHQQQKTRKRKGSLRKVALLGRGAAREKRDVKPLSVDTTTKNAAARAPIPSGGVVSTHLPHLQQKQHPLQNGMILASPDSDHGQGLGISGVASHPSLDGYPNGGSVPAFVVSNGNNDSNKNSRGGSIENSKNDNIDNISENNNEPQVTSPSNTHGSTTDDDDVLSIPARSPPSLQSPSLSSISDSYFPRLHEPTASSLQRRRSSKQHAKSPLSLQGLAAAPLAPATDEEHDYSETEWWGWVILAITWFVFVIGMGSCLNIWSWAWDVGTTPYAPPELEDDPTLPIVGYYPALMILTCIMAWVWVVVAWVGMKYFRHAKISSVD